MITLSFDLKSIVLRNPDFQNQQTVDITRIVRKTSGGDLKIFRDPIWPRIEILSYKFSFLKQSDLNNLLTFFDYSLGQIITLIDYEGKTWKGFILTPNDEVSQPGTENFTAQFKFQSLNIYTLSITNTLIINQSNSMTGTKNLTLTIDGESLISKELD